MQDIADKVGVSKALVSMVFRRVPGPSAETRQRVLEAAEKLGYRPNRSAALLSSRRSHLIGVMANIRNTFHAEMVEDIVAEADAYGLRGGARCGDADARRVGRRRHAAGLPLRGAHPARPELADAALAELGEQGAGRSSSGDASRDPSIDVVRTADGRGIGRVVDHLVELGHRRISHLSGGTGTIPDDRKAGYRARDETARAGRRDRHHRGRLHRAGRDTCRPSTPGSGATARPQYVRPTTAARSGSSTSSAVPGSTCPAVSRSPDTTTACWPGSAHIDLTTVSQEPRQQAERAVKAVVERLDEGRRDRLDVLLEPRLVTRNTTTPEFRQARLRPFPTISACADPKS